MRRAAGHTQVLPILRTCIRRRTSISRGQGRGSQRRVTKARGSPAKVARGLDGRVGRGPGRTRVTPVGECIAPAGEADGPVDQIVSRLGLIGDRAELCGSSDQIALK